MATTQLARPLTYDDLLQTPDDLNRYEIINGELIVSPAPSLAHQLVLGQLFAALFAHAQQHRLGTALVAPVDIRLSPHNIVEPDLLFLRPDRFRQYRRRGFIDGPPDLAAEIISPSSKKTDTVNKAALYAQAGVPEYWIVDPDHRAFRMLLRGDDGVYRDVPPTGGRYHSTVIDGLVVDPDELFAVLD